MTIGDLNINAPTNEAMPPSLQLTDYRGQRYPNPFFDLSQQYMPPTIKELIRWCTYYFYNSPLIGQTIKKTSRYPITDLIYEDSQESTRSLWKTIFDTYLKIKERHIEINLDLKAYGNAFISVHLPFIRFLICPTCGERQPIQQWDWHFRGSDYVFAGTCSKCSYSGGLDVKDVPYKDIRGVRIIRWSPENMHIKFNDYTGRYIYMYTVPPKLRNMIIRGDKDILEDTPMIVIEALQKRRMIRFHPDAIFHLKEPTLAEQDQGWGKPAIIHVLKDMYYLYTLRRAQEAIAHGHILPLDLIFPLPNAQQDPYIHTDLANWRIQIESIIHRHRRDPNFKGVLPVPVGTARVGGDGKLLLVTPELNYLNQTIVGGLGMSSELMFGNGLNYTGSSITLRMLENDFIQNRGQLIDMTLWIKDKLRVWLNYPNIQNIRFSEFRMADDVQRNQQNIGLNAQGKISDQTLLASLGHDWNQEVQKMVVETQVKNYLMDLQSKGSAKSQGEAMLIQNAYQKKIQELMGSMQPPVPGMPGADQGQLPAGGEEQPPPEQAAEQPVDPLQQKIDAWANKIMGLEPSAAQSTLTELKARLPNIGIAIEQKINELRAGSQPGMSGQGQTSMNIEPNMSPMPVQGAPRRAEAL